MPDLTFKTKITKHTDQGVEIRGEKLTDLIKDSTFTQSIFLILQSRKPNDNELAMLDAILVSGLDHGPGPASGFVPRVVVSTGNTVNAALAAGVLAIGDYHGGAIEGAMQALMLHKTIAPADLVKQSLESSKRLAGFGHKLYKDADPRTTVLEQKMKDLGLSTDHFTFARAIESELEKQKGKKLVLNIDGAIAAILLDLGFTNPKIGKAIFALSRFPGMIAHTLEELENEDPVRRIPEDQIEHVVA